MTTDDIRSRFLSFFKSKGHTVVASDSLVPKDDPTVLFTTAGMQQFKPQFLGRDLTYTRAATCQKCLRTDDLDVVGKTDFHHTFFEMLGNFSFGDYFKKDAIAWGWEFLTKDLKLPKEKLWVSVYKDDQEAYGIWFNDIKVPAERIVKLGDKSNFWPSNARLNGPNGPCGPCSEIFYDYGVNPDCPKGKDCDPDCSCGRFSEVWNLVFTQFNRKDGGVLEPLPAKNIDTGMGLERLAAVVQGKKSNYETDNFVAILNVIRNTFAYTGVNLTESEYHIVADHMRAIVFGIADGVVPSNEHRGYVIRKLIVSVTDLAIRASIKKPIVHTFVDVVVDVMRQAYPELIAKAPEVKVLIQRAEEAYFRIRTTRVPEFEKIVKSIMERQADTNHKNGQIGIEAFSFKDTHGLALSTIWSVVEKYVKNNNDILKIKNTYETLMKGQQERSRSSNKMTGKVFSDFDFKLDVAKTKFLGYEQENSSARILKFFIDDEEAEQVYEGDRIKIILDQTTFYAESGGQVSDTGDIYNRLGALIKIDDVQKINDIFIHSGIVKVGEFSIGDTVETQIDKARRVSIMRNHTATHLLQAALREVLGSHIKQQGSLVEQGRLRFDFTHPGGVRPEEIQKIESRINAFIKNADKVTTEVLSLEEAKKKGALAFFAEKYGQTVRVISIGNYSKEFCGGTHVSSTAQIEDFKIISEGSVAQGIRRIEAVTGKDAVGDVLKQRQQEEAIRQESLRLRKLEKEKGDERLESLKDNLDNLVKDAEQIKGIKIITQCFGDITVPILRTFSDLLKQKAKSAIVVLGAQFETDATLLVSATDDVVAKGFRANELINQIAPLIGGSGGGRPNMAQAGGKSPDNLEYALAKAKEIVKASI